MRIVLASASPRRRELLNAAGIECDVDPVDVDEGRLNAEAPAAYVERVAVLKAKAGAVKHPTRIVLGADTAVAVGDVVLGKPRDAEDARGMLRMLAGRSHHVLTGVAVAHGTRLAVQVDSTTVHMRAISDDEIAAYVATGEPLDKAGAYAIQGAAAAFVSSIVGAQDNVVGLPIALVTQLLREIEA